MLTFSLLLAVVAGYALYRMKEAGTEQMKPIRIRIEEDQRRR
jgi:hypothetical protein